MEPSQRRNNGKYANHCYDNQRCHSSYIWIQTKHGLSISIRLARKACDEGSPPPAGRSFGCMNLCPPPPEVLAWKDKGGIQIGLLGHGYLPHPITVRKVIQDWSIRRADRSPGGMLYNIGNSERAWQELRYEWLLSTSKGSNGLKGDGGNGFRSFSFFCGSRDGSEGVWVSGFPFGTWHAASRGKEDGQNGRTNVFFLPRILGGFFSCI